MWLRSSVIKYTQKLFEKNIFTYLIKQLSPFDKHLFFLLVVFNHQQTTRITSTTFFLVGIISFSSYLLIREEKHETTRCCVEDVDASHNHWGSSLFSDAPDAVTWAKWMENRHQCLSGWWFQVFVIFTPTLGNDPSWLIFFKGVETSN